MLSDVQEIAGWQVGKEVVKTLEVKNVSLGSLKVNYILPKTEYFDMDYPQVLFLPTYFSRTYYLSADLVELYSWIIWLDS